MSPTNRTFPKKPAKTLSEEKSREFPHSLGSLPSISMMFSDVSFQISNVSALGQVAEKAR
jgi:hypothetical protein